MGNGDTLCLRCAELNRCPPPSPDWLDDRLSARHTTDGIVWRQASGSHHLSTAERRWPSRSHSFAWHAAARDQITTRRQRLGYGHGKIYATAE
jgi:hypothetical protein